MHREAEEQATAALRGDWETEHFDEILVDNNLVPAVINDCLLITCTYVLL